MSPFFFESTHFEGVKASETFSFAELSLHESLKGEDLQKELNQIFEAWVWDKLNISYSIVTDSDCDDGN